MLILYAVLAERSSIAEVWRGAGAAMPHLRREDNERCRHTKAAQYQGWVNSASRDQDAAET